MSVTIRAKFKTYDDLRQEYGFQPDDRDIDSQFDGFLKLIAEKDVQLTNYNAKDKSFDTAFIIEDPNQPGQTRLEFPFGIQRQYTQNLGINLLQNNSIQITDGDTAIYCTNCGFTVDKKTRFDFVTIFNYGDIYNGNCETDNTQDNISGTTQWFDPIKPKNTNDDCDPASGNPDAGDESKCRMWCVKCRNYHIFKTVGSSLN